MKGTRDYLCLVFPAFQGDETDVTQLRNQMLVARYSHDCAICFEEIPARSRVRALTERNNEDRIVKTFYFCVTCCDAMARSWKDHGEEITSRHDIGVRNSRKRRAA